MPPDVVDALADMSVEQAVCLSVALFSGSLVPFFLLINVEAEHLVPRAVRELPARAREMQRKAALSAAVLLLILTAPKGATR
jgi:hypothetical protein